MIRIFLIGYMGAGKTTLGKALARELRLAFVDLDTHIERRFHKSVTDVFAERGEEGFRLLERQLLHEVAEFEDVVISTGGGTPCFFDNLAYMRSMGTTVFLEAGEEALFRRLKAGRRKRPLLRDKTDDQLLHFLRTSLAARLDVYRQADYTLNSDLLEDAGQIAGTVARTLSLLGLDRG